MFIWNIIITVLLIYYWTIFLNHKRYSQKLNDRLKEHIKNESS